MHIATAKSDRQRLGAVNLQQRLWPATILAMSLAFGLILVPATMGAFWETSAIGFTIATIGQVLRPHSGLPLYAALAALVAAWAPGHAGVRIAAGTVGAAITQTIITFAGYMGLVLTVNMWTIPPAALGAYESVYDTFAWEGLVLVPVAAVVGAGVSWAWTVADLRTDGRVGAEPPMPRH